MTTDWRIYEMLTKADWRPGDEPKIVNKVTIRYEGREIVIPLPAGAVVDVDEKPKGAQVKPAGRNLCPSPGLSNS